MPPLRGRNPAWARNDPFANPAREYAMPDETMVAERPRTDGLPPWWMPAAAGGMAEAGRQVLPGVQWLLSQPQQAGPVPGQRTYDDLRDKWLHGFPSRDAQATSQGAPMRGAVGAARPNLPMPSMQASAAIPPPKRPAYDYHIEMLKSADAGDAYARDFTNLRESARAAAAQSQARGERFVFVPVHDYRSNTLHLVNAQGTDTVLDLNDEDDKGKFLAMTQKIGLSPMEVMEWSRRSSRPLMGYMRPSENVGDVRPDFSRHGVQEPQRGTVPPLAPQASPSNIRSLAEGPGPGVQQMPASYWRQPGVGNTISSLDAGPAPAPIAEPRPVPRAAAQPQSEGVAEYLARTGAGSDEAGRRFGAWDWENERPR